MEDQAGAAAVVVVRATSAEDDAALRNQLAGLEAQREQLASLLGDDPQSPLLQLQVCVHACM